MSRRRTPWVADPHITARTARRRLGASPGLWAHLVDTRAVQADAAGRYLMSEIDKLKESQTR